MGPWNPSPSSESQRLRNLYESIGMPCSVVILLFYAASSERFRKLRKHFFLFPACAKNPLQYTGSPCPHTVTGFCRCFAFQIGKIRHLHVFIRHFRFQKCLLVSSCLRFYFFRQIVQIHPAVHLFFQKSFFFLFFLYDAVQSRIIAGRVLHLLL